MRKAEAFLRPDSFTAKRVLRRDRNDKKWKVSGGSTDFSSSCFLLFPLSRKLMK